MEMVSESPKSGGGRWRAGGDTRRGGGSHATGRSFGPGTSFAARSGFRFRACSGFGRTGRRAPRHGRGRPTINLVISEFRLRGQQGEEDEFVEIYNAEAVSNTADSPGGEPALDIPRPVAVKQPFQTVSPCGLLVSIAPWRRQPWRIPTKRLARARRLGGACRGRPGGGRRTPRAPGLAVRRRRPRGSRHRPGVGCGRSEPARPVWCPKPS